jgi:hypothetical protein
VDTDPRTNVVVFHLAPGKVVGAAPTLDEDGVRQAWEVARRGRRTRAGQVVAVHSEWEPSAADAAFLAATFPGAAVSYNFRRPGPEGWDDALAVAGAALREAATLPAAGGELRPVLWSESSPSAGLLADVPHWPVAAGRLHLGLAVVAPTAHGTIGIHHVTHRQLGDEPFDELVVAACRNLAADMAIEHRETGEGPLPALSGTLFAAAVCLPDFHRELSALVGSARLVAGLPSPDEVYVAGEGSPLAAVVERMVRESDYPTTELVPCLLSVTEDSVAVVTERAT